MSASAPPPFATVLVGGAATAGRYAVVEATIPAGTTLPNHVHRHESVYVLVIAGALRLLEDGRTRDLVDGDHARLMPQVPRQLRADADTRLLVVLVPAGADRLAGVLGDGADGEDRAALLAAAGIDLLPAYETAAAPPPPVHSFGGSERA